MRICVEGNIGAGKSTVLAHLAATHKVCPEPVHEWTELLNLFYNDPHRWALTMNMQALTAFTQVPPSDEHDGPVIVERSPLSCKEVFARSSFNQDFMTSEEWELFCRYHQKISWLPDAVIYLKSSPSTCMERVRRRGRPEESGITREYLTKLQFAHTTMLKHFEQVHVVDADQPPSAVLDRVTEILNSFTQKNF